MTDQEIEEAAKQEWDTNYSKKANWILGAQWCRSKHEKVISRFRENLENAHRELIKIKDKHNDWD